MKRLPCLIVLLLLWAQPTSADLIRTGPTVFGGTGIGAVHTVLTIQNTGTESGCVARGPTGDIVGPAACPPGVAGGHEHTAPAQTQTRSLGELGITSAGELRIVLNPSEPGGDSITLTQLVLRIFSPTGTVLFTSGLAAPITFPDTATGAGNSGFLFRMDDADIAAAQPFFADPTNRIGLAATLTDAAGGNETFFVFGLPCPAITLSPAALPVGVVGSAYSETLTASGGEPPFTFTLASGALPEGLTLSPSGTLSGVPTGSGTFAITVQAVDANGCRTEQGYNLDVSVAVPTMPLPLLAVLVLVIATIGYLRLRNRGAAWPGA